ncbi:hypothetical protein PsorP6_001245 [Peronosclerospora sorghi]|uniref:Uncharacterized protein n=1 Tax=Peronosclerospora sorghi TaxID=230839 RepID=A0ACC0WSM5_9STRA|nr:hypothetical protein PsorP6_001245 [Peronosclerospora sorghi]
MAGGNRFTVNPFPDLMVTREDRAHLIEIANSIVIDKLKEYQEYIDNNKIVDLTRWRKYQSNGNTLTYIERKNSTLDCKLPASLIVSPLQGSLDENMFGLMSPTLESMRIKSSYLNDFHAGAVVSTIVQPTVEEPFHSVIVKWMQIDIPGASTGLIHNRDYVYLETTGILRLHSGDRVGYHLLHSVTFPQTHELPHCIRGNMSICGMFHEEAPNRTFCRGTGVMDLKGGIPRVLGIHGMVNATMVGIKYSYCAQMKKLAWLLEMKNAQRSERCTRAFKPEARRCAVDAKELRSLSASNGSDESVPRCYCERTGAPKAMYTSQLQENVERRHVVVRIMKNIEGIDEVDRARCILKCLALYERDANELADVMGLTLTNKQRACDAALQLRRHLPGIFPAGFSDDHMATLIGVIKTNSHELENLGGSGLFLSACRLEHSSMPSCSFTTFGSTLWVTAIRPDAPGNALSIDYGNFFYRPTP